MKQQTILKSTLCLLLALVCNVAWADITQQWTTAPSPWGATDISEYPTEVGTNLTTAQGSKTGTVRKAETKVTKAKDGTVTIVFEYTGGGHKLNILGVDLVDADGTVKYFDYHYGKAPGDGTTKTYTLQEVEAGDYTLRYFVCNNSADGDQLTMTNGNIVITGLDVYVQKNTYTINIQDALTTIKIGDKTYSNGETVKVEGFIKKSDLTVVAPDGKFAAVSINDATLTINVYFAALPTQAASATYINAVLYPAQQTEVGEAVATTSGNVYTLSNKVLVASFAKMGGAIYFAGSKAMDLVAGTELFTVAFGTGTTVPASGMTLGEVALKDLAPKANAVGGADHYKGKALEANYTYNYEGKEIAIVWRAVLRDGSHYLRTEMELTGVDDVDMFNIIPMIYNVDTKAAGSTPEVIGNTRGAVLMSNKIFAGLETPTAYNTVGDATGEEDNWNLTTTKDDVALAANSWAQLEDGDKALARLTEVTGAGYQNLWAYKQEGVVLKEGQKVEVKVQYKSGAHRLNFGGADLLASNGDIAANDYHSGYSGGQSDKNTFSFIAPNDGTFTIRVIVENKSESIDATSALTTKIYTAKEGVVVNTDIVGIQGRWSRNTTLAAGETWKVAAVVGLIAQDGTQANADIHSTQKRRSFLAYSERERAVPWRAMPMYLAWYELQINRNNADPGREHLDNTKEADVLDVLAHWKSDLYDRYGIAPEVFIIDDGWDKYGEWTFHDAFPDELRNMSAKAKEMGAGIGAWLGPVGGYGASGNHRRAYWNSTKTGGMQLSNPDYYAAFKKAAHNLVKNQGDNYIFFKFDGISGQFSSVGPDAGDTGNENAEGIIRLEQYVREELREDIFFNTSVGTWASPFWYQITDATWRQENDHDRTGNNSYNRENWITYRDRLVYQNYVKNSPICPINTLMTHGFILTKFGPPASDERDYLTVRNELRAAFLCGSGMVEVYNDYDLMNSINGGALWADLAECIAWQKRNADVLPDAHWVGGNPWTGSKAEVYGWAAWNGTKSSLALRNGANDAQTFTFTLRSALNIPKHVKGSIILRSAFGDQATLQGLTEGQAYGIDDNITVTLPGSSVYGFEGIDASATIKHVSSLSLSAENNATQIATNQSLVIKATINSDATFPALAWTSSNPAIADVVEGLVIPKKDGTVTITVATKDGSDLSQTYTVKIVPAPVLVNAGTPVDGKQYYIYADTYSGGAYVNRMLYNNNGTLSMTATLEEGNNNFLWTCHVDKEGKYTFQNVGDNTKWLGHKALVDNAYNFTLGKAATHEGTTLWADAANDGDGRYLVAKNDGSGFDQSTSTYNQASSNFCTDFVFANFFQPEGNSIRISTNYTGGGKVLVNGKAISLPYVKWENMFAEADYPLTLTATTTNNLFNFLGFFKEGVNVGTTVEVNSLAEAVEYEARYEFSLIKETLESAIPVRIYSNNNNSYAIKMNAAEDYTDKAVNSGGGTYEENEVWYLVGNAASFKMYSRVADNALALKLSGNGSGSAATLAAEGTELTLVAQSDGSYNICPKSNTGQSFNMYGGAGGDIKLYGSNDGNSKWRFQRIDVSKALTLNYNAQTEGGYAQNYKIGEVSINIAGTSSRSMLDKTNIPTSRTCYLPEDAQFGISKGLMCHGWTMTFNGEEDLPTQILPEGGLTVNVNIAVDESNKYQYLFYTPGPNGHPYRIPAIVTTANGYVFAINDFRPCGGDIGNGDVDLVMRYSATAGSDWDGYSWTDPITIVDGEGHAAHDRGETWKVGFGDPAVVADRETNEILVMSVCGNRLCWNGNYGAGEGENPNRIARIYITYDEATGRWVVGDPKEVTYDIYPKFKDENGKVHVGSMFIGAGRIAQSSRIKVGTHYRIYCAVWAVETGSSRYHNYAIYSDDFGKSWNVLGELGWDNCPAKYGNEPKCEELPDGSVLLSSRKGYGRYFNVYRYTDVTTGEGAWMGEVSTDAVGDLKWGSNDTNGEPLRIGNVLFQSAPTGNGRSDVAVFYKVLSNDPADYTPTKLSKGWTKIPVSDKSSAYTSMTILPDGNIGLYYEEAPGDYSMVYVPLILKDILPADVYAALSALPPTYASEMSPVWHNITFGATSNVLLDNGAGNNAVTSNDKETDGAMWNVVGSHEQFYLVSKLGNYLAYDKATKRYITTNNKKERVALTLKENIKGSWEMMRKGASKSLCEVAVKRSTTGEVGEGTICGKANQIAFDDLTPEVYEPNIFSTEKAPVYYQVVFKNGGWALTDKGAETEVRTATKDVYSDVQYWQFIGTPESFYMKSKDGNWLGTTLTDNNTLFYKATTEANKVELSVFATGNVSYAGAYEIKRVGQTNCMNMYQGAGNDKKLSEWGAGDGGNPVTFMEEPKEIEPLPYFSTEDAPEYWWIQFCKGGAVIADQGVGANVLTKDKAYTDAQLWQLVGNEGSFYMKNKAGRYLSWSGSRFQTTESADSKATLILHESTNSHAEEAGCYEIQLSGNSYMNQNGGAGTDKELATWGKGDPNNHFVFVSAEPTYPDFDNMEAWYYIQFGNGKWVIEDKGVGNNVLTAKLDDYTTQKWRVTGDKSNCQIINQEGHYLVYANNRIQASTTADAQGFKLVATTNSSYPMQLEIQHNSNSLSFNMHQGAGSGKQIALHNPNDGGNPLTFVPVESITFPEFTMAASNATAPAEKLTLWYTQSAEAAGVANSWMEYSLPIGNGQFGASLFGGVAKDEILFNEKTLWSGGPGEYGNYLPFGSVYIEDLSGDFTFNPTKPVQNYYRDLNLKTATGTVSYENAEGVKFTRQYIASNPDKAVVTKITASEAGKLSFRITMESGKPTVKAETTYKNGYAQFTGKLQTVSYNATLKVVAKGGYTSTGAEGITVEEADEVLIVLMGSTDFVGNRASHVNGRAPYLADDNKAIVDAVAKKGWDAVYADHVADHQSYFNRVSFELEGVENNVPTNQLITDYNAAAGARNHMLEQLYYQYGRYLSIASSRGVDSPANLQGIWNNTCTPPWHSDIHANINVQMNYWPVEAGNLSEMHEPFVNYIINEAAQPEWRTIATNKGATREDSWTLLTENNIFGGVSGFAPDALINNAWYVTHMWQHYRYTLDTDYLRRAFAAMKGASLFWVDRLVLAADGTYECPNEYSPEHGPGQENATAHAQQIVRECLSNTIQAAEVLNAVAGGLISAEEYELLVDRYRKIDDGLGTEKYNGKWGEGFGVTTDDYILREWKYTSTFDDNKGIERGHRHMSHLMALYPFSQLTPASEYFIPAINSMKLRGDESTGWSMGWKINLWARALMGERSHAILRKALKHSTTYGTDQGQGGIYYNLFDSHAPFQIDGNFGAASGVQEMLMQSHTEVIDILPALPAEWVKGSVKGLKAVGDFTVDIEWEGNQARKVTITNNQGQPCYVKCAGLSAAEVTVNGTAVVLGEETIHGGLPCYQIASNAGDKIVIDLSNALQNDKTALKNLIAQTKNLVNECYDYYTAELDGLQTTNPEGAYYVWTNAQSTGEGDNGYIKDLVDGSNDTYFHSAYGSETITDGLKHHITINLGEGNAVSAFKFKYVTRKGAGANFPAELYVWGGIKGDNDEVVYDQLATISSGLPQSAGATYTSPLIQGDKEYTHLRIMASSFFHMAELDILVRSEEYVNNFPNSVLVPAAVEKANTAVATAEAAVEAQQTVTEYTASLAALQAKYDELVAAMASGTLPVLLSSDVNNPYVYKIGIKRGDTKVLQFDYTGTPQMVDVADYCEGNKNQGWYFTKGSADGKVFIHPYLGGGDVLSAKSTINNPAAVWAAAKGTETHQEWTLPVANATNGTYNIKAGDNNNYFSNNGGVNNKMGFWSNDPSGDTGSLFVFTRIDFDGDIWKNTLNAYMTGFCVRESYAEGTTLGYYQNGAAYNEARAEAVAVLADEEATTENYKNAYIALRSAKESIVFLVPEAGKFYRFKGKVSGNYMNAVTDNTNIGMASEANRDAMGSVFYLTSNNKLLSYKLGKYLKDTHTIGAIGESNGNAISFNPSESGNDGYFTLKTDYSGSKYIYDNSANGSKVDRNGSYAANNCEWAVEEVTSLPVVISSVGFATLYAPVALNVPEEVTAYVGELGNEVLTLEEVETIPANTGVVLKGNDGSYDFEITDEADAVEENALKGTIASMVAPTNEGTIYTLQNANEQPGVAFKEYIDGSNVPNLKGFKAYLPVNTVAGAISVRFGDDGSTDIENVEIINHNSEMIYDLQGRRVLNPTKGVYIVNSKKVIVK